MNNAKMWLVVKPTVGVPLFLTAVAVGSFAVHVAVLSNTTWVSDFLSGNELGAGSATASLMLDEGTVQPASFASPQQLEAGGQVVLITMPDGTTARAVLETPTTLASVSGESLLKN